VESNLTVWGELCGESRDKMSTVLLLSMGVLYVVPSFGVVVIEEETVREP
jgi:hypothetical protein